MCKAELVEEKLVWFGLVYLKLSPLLTPGRGELEGEGRSRGNLPTNLDTNIDNTTGHTHTEQDALHGASLAETQASAGMLRYY